MVVAARENDLGLLLSHNKRANSSLLGLMGENRSKRTKTTDIIKV